MEKILATTVIAGLSLNLFTDIKDRENDSVRISVWKFFSYYTNLTNILVCIWVLILVFAPSSPLGSMAKNANVSSAITFYILTVGVANYIVFGFRPLKPMNQIADLAVHAVTPIMTIVLWIGYMDKQALFYEYVPYWLIYPLSYAAFTALHGNWSRFYPYPFTNVQELGAFKVALNALGLSICVLLGGTLFVVLGKLLA